MAAPESIRKLIEHFEQNREALRSGKYNEAQLRQEFLNPFLAALGWDMFNEQQFGEAYKEVIHETSVEVEGAAKAPDYAFRIGGVTKFFVEAKKPSVNIEHAIHPAYQVKRYAWSAKLPLAILSDFEEFAVYDCRSKPNPGDQAAAGRVMYLTYRDYIEKWDEIAAIFSKNAILKGAFDQYAAGVKGKRGTKEVDDAFLEEMEGWRDTLARNLALRNPELENVRQLNYAVQMTIDRIVFLRICEDRGIEKEGQLKDLLAEPDIYAQLCGLFRTADKRYNSGLFHFSDEKGQSSHADGLTPGLKVDDKVLKEIICDLYYPSPYVFKLIPADILGQVYERFLGKVIRLTAGHQARVEEKPEVRKAGGVYYTPTYIVDYIVKNTVGKLLEGKTPAEAAELKIVDPACGSGSFLLGAFQCLIDWHSQYYREHDPEKLAKGGSPAVYRGQGGEWQLSTREKKRILLNNLHGVDIDPQAVEVTKLSLLLKVLEEESGQLSLGFERALPDLGRNIQCGNSLIGPDYYDGRQLSMDFMDEEERQRVNAFDWQTAFPQVFAKGGFDAVIGNPPYLNIDDTWGKGDPRLKAIRALYPQIYNDKTDILFYFLGKSVEICKGISSFIVSRAFLEAYKANKLRKYLTDKTSLTRIIDFRNYFIFPGVGITTCIVTFQQSSENLYIEVYKLKSGNINPTDLNQLLNDQNIFEKISVMKSQLGSQTWTFVNPSKSALNLKIDNCGDYLNKVLIVGQGMQTGRNSIFGGLTINEINKWGLELGQFYKRASNSDIQRFNIRDRGEYILYTQAYTSFKQMQPKVQNYLLEHEKELKNRAAYKRGDCEWWKFTWPLNEKYYNRKRILCPFLASTNRFALNEDNQYLSLTDTTVLFDNEQPESLLYLLGLINSKLLTFRFKSIGKLKSVGIYEYFWNSLSKIPIRRINFSNNYEKQSHDKLVSLVDHIQLLYKHNPRTPHEKESLKREIEATDKKIDQLVYELYGLTEEEIRIVEGV